MNVVDELNCQVKANLPCINGNSDIIAMCAAATKNNARVVACVPTESGYRVLCERGNAVFPAKPYVLWEFNPRTATLFRGRYELTLADGLEALGKVCANQAGIFREAMGYQEECYHKVSELMRDVCHERQTYELPE
jgi:hypothetical protein